MEKPCSVRHREGERKKREREKKAVGAREPVEARVLTDTKQEINKLGVVITALDTCPYTTSSLPNSSVGLALPNGSVGLVYSGC